MALASGMVKGPSSRKKEQDAGNDPCPALLPQLPELSMKDGNEDGDQSKDLDSQTVGRFLKALQGSVHSPSMLK